MDYVSFFSEGARISAHLYRPSSTEGSTGAPGIVLCHGFAGVKEMLIPRFAEAFAVAGYAVLAFDYRGFGGSEGETGKLSINAQTKDIQNAVTYMRTVEGVDADRIGLWGTSLGGANAVMVAARDPRVKCVVVQLTFGDGERVMLRGKTEAEADKLRSSLERISQKEVLSNKTMAMGVNRFLTDPQSLAFFKEKVDEFPALKTKIPFTALQDILAHKPEAVVGGLSQPLLVVAAEEDAVNPCSESESLFARAIEPKELLVVPKASHYDVYDGEGFDTALSAELRWFGRYLGDVPPSV